MLVRCRGLVEPAATLLERPLDLGEPLGPLGDLAGEHLGAALLLSGLLRPQPHRSRLRTGPLEAGLQLRPRRGKLGLAVGDRLLAGVEADAALRELADPLHQHALAGLERRAVGELARQQLDALLALADRRLACRDGGGVGVDPLERHRQLGPDPLELGLPVGEGGLPALRLDLASGDERHQALELGDARSSGRLLYDNLGLSRRQFVLDGGDPPLGSRFGLGELPAERRELLLLDVERVRALGERLLLLGCLQRSGVDLCHRGVQLCARRVERRLLIEDEAFAPAQLLGARLQALVPALGAVLALPEGGLPVVELPGALLHIVVQRRQLSLARGERRLNPRRRLTP